jgi:nucleotide-binding universal stress UspA family protein
MIAWLEILCAVDFSACSRAALEDAADLARRFDARLSLVHVWRGARGAGPALAVAPPALTLNEEVELGRLLDDWTREAERLAGRKVVAVLTSGAPAEEVARLAAERHADLVVVGTHGRTGVKHAVLGSVAEGIVRQAPCAVLVARAPAEGD